MNADAHFVSASLAGIGEDAEGRWWVQVWTLTDWGESEQWFLIKAASGWVYVTNGTGVERSELPSDIVWEDIP